MVKAQHDILLVVLLTISLFFTSSHCFIHASHLTSSSQSSSASPMQRTDYPPSISNHNIIHKLSHHGSKRFQSTSFSSFSLEASSSSPSSPITPTSSSTPPTTYSSTYNNKASFLVSSTNLLKNCVGAGVFSLNFRVLQLFQDVTTLHTLPLSVIVLIVSMATWAIYNFYLIGQTCYLTKQMNYADAWATSVSSHSTSWILSIVTIAPMISCLANVIVLTDVLTLALRNLIPFFAWQQQRGIVIAILSALILFPLSIIKNLSALKSISLVGLVGQLIATIVLIKRNLDGSYLPTGKYFSTANFLTVAATTTTTTTTSAMHPITTLLQKFLSLSMSKWYLFASLLSYCFVTHYNAPRYYTELDNPKQDPQQFLKMTSISYYGAALTYLTTIGLTLKLFGRKTQTFALNTFSPQDSLANLAMFTFGISVLASFPLLFFNVRQFFMTQIVEKYLMKKKDSTSTSSGNKHTMKVTSIMLLTILGTIATKCRDIGVVGAFSGAIFGTSMMFIFPPIMYVHALLRSTLQAKDIESSEMVNKMSFRQLLQSIRQSTHISTEEKSKLLRIVLLNGILLTAGLSIGIMGTLNNVVNFFLVKK